MTALDERALVRAVTRAMENAGTLPAKDSVKLVPEDWHRICDLVLDRDGWQPIETAPKDGTLIDIWAGERFADCRWLSDEYYTAGWWFGDHGRLIDGAATHWRPLPSPPSAMLSAAGGRDE